MINSMVQQENRISSVLHHMRIFYQSRTTENFEFRRNQLMALECAIKKYEKEIFAALFEDLKKGPEESYATETGLVLAEISFTLKNLKKWMRPERLKTNLLNFPSSTRLYRDSLGVVLIIGSWNYPFQLLISPLVGAIAGGNCVVLKPSESAPATSAIISKMINETFESKYISVFEGEGSSVVPELMSATRFDYIFYTGSSNVGKIIYEAAAKELIPVTLELGGKSPAVVEKNADIKTTAKRIVIGKFLNAGQTCVAPDYVLVDHKVKDSFLQELKNSIRNFFGEDIYNSKDYGRIVNEKQFDALISLLPSPEKIEYGGHYIREQLYIEPTIITYVDTSHEIMKSEIFGPLLPVISFSDKSQALEIIMQNPKPLSFYLFSNNTNDQEWWMKHVSFGSGCINNTLWQLSNPYIPFGGIGPSGIGAYHGKFSFETFTHAKSVMSTPVWFDPKIKYPPFSGKLKIFKRLIK